MIFKEFYVDGFGILNDFKSSFEKGINIIIGCNEAGKSTLQKFFRYTLFGYPTRGEKMLPLNGGNHGGRIKSILQSGKEVTFERTGGSKGGAIKIYYENDSSQNESEWFQLLGYAHKELYENIYAFSLDELTSLDALRESEVEDKIFSVGLGLGNTSLSKIEADIQALVDPIYTSGGKKQRIIPELLKQIQDTKQQMLRIQENISSYQSLVTEKVKLEKGVPAIENEIIQQGKDLKKTEDHLKCYESFVAIQTIDNKLQKLPVLENYPAGGLEQLNGLLEKKNELENGLRDLQHGNENEQGINTIQKEINSITCNQQLLDAQQKIFYLTNNFEHFKHLLQSQNDDTEKLKNKTKFIEEKIQQISSRWSENDISTFSDLLTHRNKVQQFKKEIETTEKKKIELEADYRAEKSRESIIHPDRLMVIIGLVLICIGAGLTLYYLWWGVSLIVAGLLLIVLRKKVVKENPIQTIERKLSEIEENVKQIKQKYESYLTHVLNIDASLLPEAVLEVLEKIERVKGEITEKNELDKKITGRAAEISRFEEEVNLLKPFLKNSSDGRTENLFYQIKTEFDEAQILFRKKEDLEKGRQSKQGEIERKTENVEQITNNLNLLLRSIGADGENEFRMKYQENNEVMELQTQKENAIRTIEAIVGVGKTPQVIEYLSANEKEKIENDEVELERTIKEKRELFKTKIDGLGANRKELERLEGESELSQILTELETKKQRLTDSYKQWLAGKIALEILNEAKAKYQVEKQPEVIKKSSNYFSKISNEKYTQINASLEEKNVMVFDANKRAKQIEQLSRGTKEQLLISLRLGFIEEYEKTAEPLPLIVDEVLVNFDPLRAKRTANILHEFAENRQILIFTCHTITKEYFKGLPVNIIEI